MLKYFVQYSINKSRSMLGIVDIEWKKHIVTELDSALNKWIDSIPEHSKLVLPPIAF